MYKLLFLLGLMVCTQKLLAQAPSVNTASGSIIDSITSKPIAGATVALKEGEKQVAATTTDSSGAFILQNLRPGQYSLELSFVGYGVKVMSLVLAAGQSRLRFGAIQLVPDGKQLSGVTVTAQKALVEDKGDRLVYNAEKDISNAGGTAADVLRKVPTLTVDLNGNVQMRGNSNIKVLVNGKPSAMMARNLADALRQMPAHVIKSVEVITSPGARYDAEGAAGVINIITKKGLQGFSGSLNATAGDRNRSLGTSLNLRKKKVGLSLSANAYQYRNTYEASSLRTTLVNGQPVNILDRSNSADNTGTGGYGEMSFDWDPDSASHFNFSANVWGGDYPNNSTIFNRLTDPAGGELQAFRNESQFQNPYGNGQLDLGYTRTFKKTGQEFSLLGQFSRMPDNYFYHTDRYEGADLTYREKSTNYSRNKEYTLQADYTHPFVISGRKDTTSIKVEMGTKAIIRDIGSEYRVEVSPDGHSEMVPDPTQSNDFDYTQRVYSGYTSLRLSNQRKWNLNAGARLEHTVIRGNFVTTQTKLNNEYTNVIPSINLSRGIDKHTLKVSYTQRITRPLIWYLNPWVNQSDPKNLTTGTPDLKPELTHATELAHSLSGKNGFSLNTALYWRTTGNAIEYLATVNPEGVSLNRPQNIARRSNYGINSNVSAQPNKNWNLNGGGTLSYVDLSSPALNQHNSGWVWHLNANTSYKLPKETTLQGYGSLNSGWIGLQQTSQSKFYWYGLSIKHEFWEKKASLTLSANNPFSRGITRQAIEVAPTFRSQSDFFFVNRSFRLTFEWRFGQMNAEDGKKGKKIKNDDSGR